MTTYIAISFPNKKNVSSIKIFELTHLLDTKGKWILVTTKNFKQDIQHTIDHTIERRQILSINVPQLNCVIKENNNNNLISYVTILEKVTKRRDR